MMGRSHALSGAVTGLAAGIVLHKSAVADLELSGFVAGFVLLNDLDSCGSSAGRCLGLISRSVAWVIRGISGGHRHGSHTILGAAAFTGLAVLACHFRGDWAGKAGLALLLVIAVSSALEALHVTDGHTADLAAIAVAAAVIWYGYGLALIPLAVGLGCLTHDAGDMLTESGVPLLLPFSQHRFHLLPPRVAFTTGTRPETWIVDPLLTLALLALAVHEVMLSLPVHALVAAR